MKFSLISYTALGDGMKRWFLSGLFCFFIIILLQGDRAILYTKEALSIWFEKLVPSMFLCMVMVRLFYDQGIFQFLLRPFRWLISSVFHMDQNACSLVFSSLLLGFPSGAVLLDEQVAKGYLDDNNAKRLFYTCSFATPGFILLTCGSVLYGSLAVGLKLLAIQWIIGILFLLMTRRQRIIMHQVPVSQKPLIASLTNALLESGKTLYMIGGYLMLFMTITSILLDFLPSFIALPVSIFTEFSNGVMVIHKQVWSFQMQMVITSMLLGFGGFCVHMQVIGMTSHISYNYRTYLFWRCLQALLSGVLAYFLFS